jgi:hypothetical protein
MALRLAQYPNQMVTMQVFIDKDGHPVLWMVESAVRVEGDCLRD